MASASARPLPRPREDHGECCDEHREPHGDQGDSTSGGIAMTRSHFIRPGESHQVNACRINTDTERVSRTTAPRGNEAYGPSTTMAISARPPIHAGPPPAFIGQVSFSRSVADISTWLLVVAAGPGPAPWCPMALRTHPVFSLQWVWSVAGADRPRRWPIGSSIAAGRALGSGL